MKESLLIAVTLLCIQATGQVTCINNAELGNISPITFTSHPYSQYLATTPVIRVSYNSWRPVDDIGCQFEVETTWTYKKEKTALSFIEDSDSGPTSRLRVIYLKGRRAPFITEDSIRVGDRISLSRICRNIAKLKDHTLSSRYPYLDGINNDGTMYFFKKIKAKNLTQDTKVRVTGITIRARYTPRTE